MTEENADFLKVVNDPESYRTKTIQEFNRLIKNEYFNEQSALGTATTSAVNIGQWLISLNALVTLDNAEWGKYREANLPFIDERQDQRYRSLAKYINLKRYPNLAYVSMNGLTCIVRAAKSLANGDKTKKVTVAEVFNHYDVNLEENLTMPDALLAFKSDVQAMLSKIKKNESKTVKPKTAAKVTKLIQNTKKKLIDEINTFINENEDSDLLKTEPVQELRLLVKELNNIFNDLEVNNTKDIL